MKCLGKQNGYKYYANFTIDSDGSMNPLGESLFTLVGFNYDVPMDINVDGLNGLQNYLNKKGFDIDFNMDDFKDDCVNDGVSESDFFDKLDTKLAKQGIIALPINAYVHDSVSLSIGTETNFDSGVAGMAIVSKKELRKFYHRKHVTQKLINYEEKSLHDELQHYTDDDNGYLYDILKYKGNDEVDIMTTYGSDLDNAKNQLAFAVNQF